MNRVIVSELFIALAAPALLSASSIFEGSAKRRLEAERYDGLTRTYVLIASLKYHAEWRLRWERGSFTVTRPDGPCRMAGSTHEQVTAGSVGFPAKQDWPLVCH